MNRIMYSTFPKPITTVFVPFACLLLLGWQAQILPGQSADPAVPVFRDGMAQVVEGFKNPADWITHDLFVETEFNTDGDGKPDRMHVSVTRQKQTDTEGLKVAVIYETSPYFAGIGSTGSDFFWDPKHELGAAAPADHEHPDIPPQNKRPIIDESLISHWVPLGFAVVHSCSPGTGLSQGCPTVGGENESLAPKAVIDWLNGRARGFTEIDGDKEVFATWCTGKVGMTGTSYNGTLPIAAATTGVEGLEAIIPVSPNTSYYHYYRANGLVRHPGGYMGEDVDVLYDFIHSGDPAQREHCDCEVRDKEMANNQDRITGDYSDWWAGRDYLNKVGKIRAATLIAHGFNDWNVMPEHSTRIYEALKKTNVPCMTYLHQGGHGGDPPRDLMNKWFTRFLYDVENDVEFEPMAWIVREGDRRNEPTKYADYPNPNAQPVTMHLTPGGEKIGGLGLTKADLPGKEKLVDDVAASGSELAAAKSSNHRLMYATPVLKEPVHLSGTSRITIKLASSKPAANLSVWLVSLPWDSAGDRDINKDIITRGWADPQNSKSMRKSEPLVPGQFYELSFDLQPDDQIIPAGEQIAVMIFSSDRDFTLWPEAGTELTIDLDATSIVMPVVGGAEAFLKATGE